MKWRASFVAAGIVGLSLLLSGVAHASPALNPFGARPTGVRAWDPVRALAQAAPDPAAAAPAAPAAATPATPGPPASLAGGVCKFDSQCPANTICEEGV